MPATPADARLIFSVDVDAGYPASDLSGLKQVDAAAGRLLDMFRRRQVRATWALGQLAGSSLARRLVDAGHEVGVLGEVAWTGPEVVRKRCWAELASRSAALLDAGAQVTSLLVHSGPSEVPSDLLAKHGIRVVRPAPLSQPQASGWRQLLLGLAQSPRCEAPARALRHGIWELASGPSLPGPTLRKTWRSLARTSGGLLSLTLDLPRLAGGAEQGWDAVESIVERAGQLRDAEQLHVQTMAQWLATTSPSAQRQPARSILGRAA
ncbi:MAG TPA: hypothetical protein VHV55_08445 [Pirellulales bacterium]|jgi:hypothetical protein|nr:hypothetical protein [Pirellulales bacterium]